MKFYEYNKRSIIKSITFRCLVLCSDFIVIVLITHRYDFAVGAIILTNVSSTVLYYLHERFWSSLPWGKRITKPRKR